MHARPPLSPEERHEAWSRLHSLTTGVAVAGIAATVAIGAVATTANPGKASGLASANQGDDAGVDGGLAAPDSTTSSDGSDRGGAPWATAPTTQHRARVAQQPAVQAPPRGSGHAHASSGGS